jgi:hypothetical protein
MKKYPLIVFFALCAAVFFFSVSCNTGGEGENWIYFTSHGEFYGTITRFRHSWYNRTPVTLEVQYQGGSTYISPGSTVTVVVSGGSRYGSMNCKAHAEDNRELEIEYDGFTVIIYSIEEDIP